LCGHPFLEIRYEQINIAQSISCYFARIQQYFDKFRSIEKLFEKNRFFGAFHPGMFSLSVSLLLNP